mmetsp:Transcript_31020/g.90739  ORF Transcript_31020/g.90739 Transcript_31020/m.90739 type:complete len:230 (+) Transcript_31020:126-815(+)
MPRVRREKGRRRRRRATSSFSISAAVRSMCRSWPWTAVCSRSRRRGGTRIWAARTLTTPSWTGSSRTLRPSTAPTLPARSRSPTGPSRDSAGPWRPPSDPSPRPSPPRSRSIRCSAISTTAPSSRARSSRSSTRCCSSAASTPSRPCWSMPARRSPTSPTSFSSVDRRACPSSRRLSIPSSADVSTCARPSIPMKRLPLELPFRATFLRRAAPAVARTWRARPPRTSCC